jgi:hypothetical protein
MGWSVVQTKSGIHAGRRPAPAPRLRLRGRAIPIYTTQLDINMRAFQTALIGAIRWDDCLFPIGW